MPSWYTGSLGSFKQIKLIGDYDIMGVPSSKCSQSICVHISVEHHTKPLGKSSLSNQGKLHSYHLKTNNVLSVLASGLSVRSQRADHRQAGNIPTPRQRTITSQAIHCTQLLPGPGSQHSSVQDLYCSSEFLKIHIFIQGCVASHSLIFCLET